MKQQLVELERIHYARVFPWVRLFQAFRLALDIRKMILGAAAFIVIFAGLSAFSYFPLDFTDAEIQAPPWIGLQEAEPLFFGWHEGDAKNHAALLARPLLTVWQPAADLVLLQPMTWSGAAIRWTQILFALCVWSFFGTAISRMAAVQFAVDQRISLKEAAAFAGSKWLWAVSAPLMPLTGVLGLWFGCVVCGWIGQIPGVGSVLLGVLWIIPLLLAFAMVLLLIGLFAGWPLMIATISTQGSDAFDGFSRSFDYVYSRFWHLVWFVIVASIHGLLMLAVVIGLSELIMLLAATSVWAGLGAFVFKSNIVGVQVWHLAIAMLVAGFAASYFWSASTIIYFLLRQSEDGTHLNEVYLPKTDQSEDLVQLAGVAASDQPVIERPPKHDPGTRQPPSESEIHD